MKTVRRFPAIHVVLTIGCFAALCATVDMRRCVLMLRSVDPWLLAAVGFIAVVSRSMRTFKWRLLLSAQGVHIPFWRAQVLQWVGSTFAFVTPAGLGSDAYRFAALADRKTRHAVASTLLVERYAGLLSVCLACVATLPFWLSFLWHDSPPLVTLLLVMALLCAALLPVLFSAQLQYRLARRAPNRMGRMRAALMRLADCLARYSRCRGRLSLFVALSIVEVFSYVLINYFTSRALGLGAPLLFFCCAMPVVYLVLRLPISIHGWGVQEGAMGYALACIGLDPAAGVAISLLQRAVELICFVLPGAALAACPFAWTATSHRFSSAAPTKPLTDRQLADRFS